MNITKQLESIKNFNTISGNLDKPVSEVLEYDMLKEELNEYLEAAVNKDKIEILDALADIMVVLVGTIHKHKLEEKFPKFLDAVCKSNMSKFCNTIEEAIQSVEAYENSGVHTYYDYVPEHNVYVIKRVDKKVLKGINYLPPIMENGK